MRMCILQALNQTLAGYDTSFMTDLRNTVDLNVQAFNGLQPLI